MKLFYIKQPLIQKIMKITEIPLCSYYGCLNVMQKDGKYYWLIENYDTDFEDMRYWVEIKKELYDSVIEFKNSKAR